MRAGERDCSVIDISCSGIRFLTPEPPPLMSMVDIRLEIPDADDSETSGPGSVHCQGAVVRTEAFGDVSGDQEVAIFFTWIDDESRLLINEYVRRHSSSARTG
jgi:hypothetical protein